tara:strand:+ start:1109 stop:3229 length:2121 start_codon:yes stop_codon:yes gene_type:complete
MVDALKDVTVLCRGGLFTNEDALSLAGTNPGAAIRMLNMEVSQFGGYRRISGFAPFDSSNTTVPGLGKILGIWIHQDKVYAARRNAGDATGTLGSNPITVTDESTTLTIAHTSHGLAVGTFVTFAGATAVGGLTINSVEMEILTAATNSFTVAFTSAGTSSASGGGSSVTYSYSYNYSIYKHISGVGWGSNVGPTGRGVINVSKLRTADHSFTGTPVDVIVDGINRPLRHSDTTFIEIFDKQGTSATDTEAQLSNAFDSVNSDATVTVDHVAHTLAVGDVVRYSGVNVNVGGVSINDTDFTVATVADVDTYTFELGSTSGVGSQTNVGGTAINFFYTRSTSSKDFIGAKYTTDFRNHQFFAGMSINPNFLAYSAPNNDLNFVIAAGGDTVNVGFAITGIAKFRDSLYIFGTDKIKKLTGNSRADFILSEVTNNIGCIASDSIIEIGGDILFLASDGIRPIQGTARIGDIELETVSKPIQQLLQALPSTHDLDTMSSVVIRNKTQFRYFFPSLTSTADSEGIIGGLRFADRRVGWEFGQLLGIQAAVSTSGLINSVETVLHGDMTGRVLKQELGNDFNGSEIVSLYATPFLYFDSTERRKVFQNLSIFTRPEGSSVMNLAVAFDWDDPNIPTPITYPLTTAGALLRYTTTGGTYDSTFTFGGSSSPVLETNIQGSARAISLVFTSTGTQAPFGISGFSITYQDAGYR